jgi:hypothetical protein
LWADAGKNRGLGFHFSSNTQASRSGRKLPQLTGGTADRRPTPANS